MPRMPRKPRTRPPVSADAPVDFPTARGYSLGDDRPKGGREAARNLRAGLGDCRSFRLDTVGDTPSKKNSRKLVCRGSRPFSFPSDAHAAWHRANETFLYTASADSALAGIVWPQLPIRGILGIAVDLFPSTARLADCSNKVESVLDFMVDAGIISDDNWREVPMVCVAFNGVDRENPRAAVEIFYA